MSRILPNAQRSQEVQTLDSVRFAPAKASMQSPTQSTSVQPDLLDRLARTVESALADAHGSQKAAAIEIQIDQSQMKRQLKLGTFDLRQQAAAGDVFLAKLGEALLEEFGEARRNKREQALAEMPVIVGRMMQLFLDAATEDK